ncbi:hypothetical protein QFZ82_003386 [Streptomyces sp. V4I23]|uniref:peptidase n=1 Tax=Streptomyces sp. V4I23 TaxID=3042282 RepID=UPI0027839420|nr:peptidase [Streptomyces sp. V4I23]MDQ1008901.1 hypothetical protein [Streptomyces sp. V4I23]
MRRVNSSARARGSAAGVAAAGMIAAAGLFAAPAHAADPVFTLGGPAEIGLRPHPGSGAPQKATLDVTVDNPRDEDFTDEYTVAFDFSGIAGVADVRFDGDATSADCEITGTTAVCTDHSIWGSALNSVARLELTAAEGSVLGAGGDIKVTGKSGTATFTPYTAKVTVGGPDLVMRPLGLRQDVLPGEAQPARISFANTGTAAADGVLLTLKYTHGIEIPERYSNCEYTKGAGASAEDVLSTAICSFDGSYEPGTVYELAEPLTVKAAQHAFHEDFVYRVGENTQKERDAQRAGASFTRGSGGKLALKKVLSARSADLAPRDNQREQSIRAKNTADFVAYGASVAEAPAGETVRTTVGFRNEGPAWIGYLRSGEDIGVVDFTVPEGAAVTGKPDTCTGVTASGGDREQQLGAPRYLCAVPSVVREDEDFALPFEMKIEKVVHRAEGKVTVRNWSASHPALPFDPDTDDNTAAVVLNSGDAGSDSGGTGDPATGGGTGGSTGGGGDDDESTGGTTGGSTTSGTSAGGATAQGGLAATGSSALLAAGGAAAALAAGAVAIVAARRRRTDG